MLKKIYAELIAIRKELRTIRKSMESLSGEGMKERINRLLVEDFFRPKER